MARGVNFHLSRIGWFRPVAILASMLAFSSPSGAANLQTDDISLSYSGISDAQAQSFMRRAEEALGFVETFFDRKPARRINIVVTNTRGIPRADNRSYSIKIPASRIRGDAPGPPRIEGRGPAIAHEITHLLAPSSGHPSRYLDEGLAVYVQEKFGEEHGGRPYPTMGHDLHEETKRYALRNGGYVSMRNVDNLRRGGNRLVRSLAYLQEGSFVRFLIEKHGLQRFMSLYEGGLYRTVYGKELREMEEEWHTFVSGIRADALSTEEWP